MTTLDSNLKRTALVMAFISATSLCVGILTIVKGTKPESYFRSSMSACTARSGLNVHAENARCFEVQDRLIHSLNRLLRESAYFQCIIGTLAGLLAVHVHRMRRQFVV